MKVIYLYKSSIGVYHQIVIQFLLHFVKRKYIKPILFKIFI